MTGAKTNERPGTRAQVKHVRVSAYKAREILDEIRGLHVADAADVLDLSERAVSRVIGKCLDSAVANAENNDLQDADELFVAACYADEGPTMKRWRPRARGRATRIRKRTCHITVIVGRLDEESLERRRAKIERRVAGGGRDAKADRAARVAKSRGDEELEEVEDIAEEPSGAEVDETLASTTTADLDESSDAEETDEVSGTEEAAETDFGPDSHAALEDGSMPDGFAIKGNADSMKYHQPQSRWYENTVAEVWFATTEAAEAAGFTEAGTKVSSDDADEPSGTEEEDE